MIYPFLINPFLEPSAVLYSKILTCFGSVENSIDANLYIINIPSKTKNKFKKIFLKVY